MAKAGHVRPEYTLEQARVIISLLMDACTDSGKADAKTKAIARRALEVTDIEVRAAEVGQTDLRKRSAK